MSAWVKSGLMHCSKNNRSINSSALDGAGSRMLSQLYPQHYDQHCCNTEGDAESDK
jgi:hypothetical protein